MKFIFFLMHQLDSSVPSNNEEYKCSWIHSTNKSEYISLIPLYYMYSTGGLPFFINSAHDIIRKCIGTPSIASALARYPTVQDDVRTYADTARCKWKCFTGTDG